MSNSSTNARNADLSSTKHRFPWKWYLSDLSKTKKNGMNVFSCFSCGGGSTMGYKLAGYNVIGNCEIDPDMMKIYRHNHGPKYSYLMDIRDFVKREDLPSELYNLDILDGSPPCSVFSTAGKREDGWNREKVFREGQKKQRLDDLFFWFIDVAKRLQPKVVIAENVKGLIIGNAKGYVNEIIKAFDCAGYKVQIFLLNSAKMGVPQARERVFFVASRKDLNYPKLSLSFHEQPILFGQVRAEKGAYLKDGIQKEMLKYRKESDKCLADINLRKRGKACNFNSSIISDKRVAPTLASGGSFFRMYDGLKLTKTDFVNCQSFPQDYDFLDQPAQYVCGMSVPPVMMANIANEIERQWLNESD